ncbi:hypothetical protein H4582DRAFT_1970781 [Lactarius indigo]|nr:hypothetical protein H4582DRAFT_1970781 [Lactarius indigo]
MCGLFRDKSRCERRYRGAAVISPDDDLLEGWVDRWVVYGRTARSQSRYGDERETAFRASVSLAGEVVNKISTAPRTCVAQGKRRKRRSRISQKGGHTCICIKEIVSETPQSSISPRLAQPIQQKEEQQYSHCDIDPAKRTRTNNTQENQREMYRELISHTTSRSKRKTNQGARHAQVSMKNRALRSINPLRSHIHRRKFVRTTPTRVCGTHPGQRALLRF